MIYYIVFIITYAILNGKFNQLVIDKKDWHFWQWLKVALVGIWITLFLLSNKVDDLSEYFKLLFVFINIYWIVFDISVNLFRGLKWHYVGKTAWLDRNIGGWQFYIKIAMLFFTGLILMYYI